MKRQFGILVDLDRCVGCYACEVACKQENDFTVGTPWIQVCVVGPKVVHGKLKMYYVPRILDGCNFCRSRGLQPSCVDHCPTKALMIFSSALMLDAFSTNTRYQICNIVDVECESG
jgi:Fe-S-cluster-containing dehydrogenase component